MDCMQIAECDGWKLEMMLLMMMIIICTVPGRGRARHIRVWDMVTMHRNFYALSEEISIRFRVLSLFLS